MSGYREPAFPVSDHEARTMPDRFWTFRATKIKDANGLWYRLECRCFVCRQRDGRLCDYIVDFIRAQPKYAKYEVVPYE